MATRSEQKTISVRELRDILYGVVNQDLSVRELRAQLFELRDQDFRVEIEGDVLRKMSLYCR